MFTKTSLNLDIQTQYFDLLREFLDSEYTALRHGEIFEVFQLERSIHSILRTIHARRAELREQLTGLSVREYASELPAHLGSIVLRKLDCLTGLEAACADKAARNAEESMMLAGPELGSPSMMAGGNYIDSVLQGRVQ